MDRMRSFLTLLALSAPLLAQADSPVVVPGKSAGYLYLTPSVSAADGTVEEDKRISVAVFKLGGFIEYRIESEPAGLLCDTNCSERADKVPGGRVALKIVGNKPVPGLEIPLKGKWQAPCEETVKETDICELNLTALNAQVRVTVDPSVEAGTEIPLPEGGNAMFMQMNSSEGYILVAGHELISPANTLSWLTHDPARKASLGLSSRTDGPGNTQVLANAGSEAARYCLNLGNGWYLPARDELNLINKKVRDSIPDWRGAWSSTEKEFEYKVPKYGVPASKDDEEKWAYKAYYYSSSADDTTAYEYKLEMKKGTSNWVLKTDSTKRDYQAFCYRRLPL